MNLYRDPSEQQVRDIQEERRTTFEQVKSLKNIISLVEIKVNEDSQLRELYIIKLKRDICMLDTNIKDFPEEKNIT